MKSKNIYRLEEESSHKVSIKKKTEGTVYKLKNNFKEELQIIVDNGDEILINGKPMPYHEFEELYMLMTTVVKHDKTIMSDFIIK